MLGIDPTIDDLRAFVRITQARSNTASLAQDIRVASDVLDRFATGKGGLSVEGLCNLTERAYGGHFKYDEDTASIIKVPRAPPKSIGKPAGRYTRAVILEGRENIPEAPLWPMAPDEKVNGGKFFSQPLPKPLNRDKM